MTELVDADVAVVGSGPAGVAVAEQLARSAPGASIAVIERGPLLLRRHFYAGGGSVGDRDRFLAEHRLRPWLGSMAEGGALLPLVGGRGAVGGAQLHRFYPADMTLWPGSAWPVAAEELAPFFDLAEAAVLGRHAAQGEAQAAALELLEVMGAQHPPYAEASAEAQQHEAGGYPHRSSVERMLELGEAEGAAARVRLLQETVALRLVSAPGDPSRARVFECLRLEPGRRVPVRVAFRLAVLAASPIESARLVMGSLPAGLLSPAVGRYLAEHVYARGFLDVSGSSLARSPLNLVVPPQHESLDSRFQLEIRSAGRDRAGRALLRVIGSAAMDPRPENRVRLVPGAEDELGLPRAATVLERSPADERRVAAMIAAMQEVQRRTGAPWSEPPALLPVGASYHESGTLRIGAAPGDERAADRDGLIDGLANVYTGDAAAFPTVGVANPILTLTAMGYRLGQRLARIAADGPPR